eukprot:6635935-Alexandrium_andersonii.AAC.1
MHTAAGSAIRGVASACASDPPARRPSSFARAPQPAPQSVRASSPSLGPSAHSNLVQVYPQPLGP